MRACTFWLPWLAASTLPLRACTTTIGGLRASRTEEGTNQVGHIFVMNTDLRFLACDAWLCPVSETMELSPHWQRSIRACELPERPHDWGTTTSGSTTGTRVVRCLPRTEAALRRRREQRYKQYEHPDSYLALVMGRGLSIAQRAQTLHEFLNKVAEELLVRPTSRFGRALPLVAVPIFNLLPSTYSTTHYPLLARWPCPSSARASRRRTCCAVTNRAASSASRCCNPNLDPTPTPNPNLTPTPTRLQP